jgi:hypothetical protein
MFHLQKSLDDPGLQDPEWRKPRSFYNFIDKAVMEDGQRIDVEDPAVALFLKILDLDTCYQYMTLEDMSRRVFTYYLMKFQRPGLHGYDSSEMDHLMAIGEQPGGWHQLDRVIQQISAETFSSLVQRSRDALITHPEDPGLGGSTCYSLGIMTYYDGADARPNVALASEPKYVMALIDQVLSTFDHASDPWDCDYKKFTCLWVELNGTSVFTLPLACTSGNDLPYEGVVDKFGRTTFSVTTPRWKDLTWNKSDLKLMTAFANAAPAEARRFLKGNFLTDELGV